jgi:uncharacterized RDD family membrane protein YckC
MENAPPNVTKDTLPKYGTLLQRMCAYFIDHILAFVATLLTVNLIFRGSLALGLYPIAGLILPGVGPGPLDVEALWESYSVLGRLRVMLVIVVLPRWTYMTVFHGSRWQATPGKVLLGLKIADSNGLPIGYLNSALRSFIRGVLYVCTLGLSGLVNLYLIDRSPKGRAIHDRIVGSEVIRASLGIRREP